MATTAETTASTLATSSDVGETRVTRTFDDLRGELARLFLAASIGGREERERAGKVLSSILAPEARRGPPPQLAVTQRNAIVEASLAGVDDPETRADRMAELENRIFPVCKVNLQWPDDVSIDIDAVMRSLSRRRPRPPTCPWCELPTA